MNVEMATEKRLIYQMFDLLSKTLKFALTENKCDGGGGGNELPLMSRAIFK